MPNSFSAIFNPQCICSRWLKSDEIQQVFEGNNELYNGVEPVKKNQKTQY